ncbi:gastric triacylglycerol lipase-like [Diorhabda carinulata]|uniref:gastric triacylglycerol lipase-like n=1 Tax=Diorhabda carinulata TaxID=1163345 RepID=UPI0025A0CBFE|nr:gastric triacylglycerol lipase-like [Diorhabda carinulata]
MDLLFSLMVIALIPNTFTFKIDLASFNNVLRKLEKVAAEKNDTNVNGDIGLDIYKFLKKYDYPFETHWVRTEDGYMLRMQRLLGGRNQTFYGQKNKPAVLLMHGLCSSAMDFISMGPNKSIGLILADAGYDVWLGNNRGNTWSRNHILLNPDTDTEFWDYSFETCGYYDLPAKIDYIIEKTGQKKVFYIGHSQGTTQFFAMAALRPEYNEKIALMVALAPVAYMGNMSSPILKFMANNLDFFKLVIVNILKLNEMLSHSPIYNLMAEIISKDESGKLLELGASFVFLLCGFNNRGFDRNIIPVMVSNAPAGISSKMLVHYGQEIASGKFQRYDYGIANFKYYKSIYPPEFNISEITAPVALYYSQNDLLAAVQDVERFASKLPNLVKLKLLEDKRFNHLDFIYGKDSYKLIYKDLLEFQKQFIPKIGNAAAAMSIKNIHYIITVLTVCIFVLQ